ncbi:hypothetical protein [Pseudoduganella violaceinigra]|uniref:hypothetical protein n=1 Tax=Pseudoduganella violaceinigra TaxID=246602 RepID=UPI0006851F5E|nr:hypothetical protein [Pseudoduganella violaceinigra]
MNSSHEPIAERIGHIGGIESLVLDGQTYFFGFDYSNDLVVSPLLDSIDVMAQFAHHYMEQLDGTHDAAYWRDLAQESIAYSELCSELEDRSFSSTQLAATAALIAQAAQDGYSVSGLNIEYHLLYLLSAAGGWAEPSIDDIETFIAQLTGQETPQSNQSLGAVANELHGALRQLVSAAPGNWATKFATLHGD